MVNRIFIISGNPSALETLVEITSSAGWLISGTATDPDEARSRLQYLDADILMINTPFIAESGDRLAKDLCYIKPEAGLLVAVSNEKKPLFEKRLTETLSFIISKPISKASLLQALSHLRQALIVLQTARQNYSLLEQKLETLRVINRAKNILISNLQMTEQQAHRYIQKQSMDMRLSPKEVAQGILNTYEL